MIRFNDVEWNSTTEKNMAVSPRLFQMNFQMILSLFLLIEYWQIVDPQWMFLNFPDKHLYLLLII